MAVREPRWGRRSSSGRARGSGRGERGGRMPGRGEGSGFAGEGGTAGRHAPHGAAEQTGPGGSCASLVRLRRRHVRPSDPREALQHPLSFRPPCPAARARRDSFHPFVSVTLPSSRRGPPCHFPHPSHQPPLPFHAPCHALPPSIPASPPHSPVPLSPRTCPRTRFRPHEAALPSPRLLAPRVDASFVVPTPAAHLHPLGVDRTERGPVRGLPPPLPRPQPRRDRERPRGDAGAHDQARRLLPPVLLGLP